MSAYTSTAVIRAEPSRVFEFVSDPENQPQWAINFVRSTRPLGNGRYVMETPLGELEYAIRADRATGTIDWVFPTPAGDSVLPARVTPHREGAVFSFTVLRMPAASDEDWERGRRGMDEEVETLKRLLEA